MNKSVSGTNRYAFIATPLNLSDILSIFLITIKANYYKIRMRDLD